MKDPMFLKFDEWCTEVFFEISKHEKSFGSLDKPELTKEIVDYFSTLYRDGKSASQAAGLYIKMIQDGR